jgi:hypothetical protein
MFKPYLMIKRKAVMTYTNPNTAARKNFLSLFPLQFTSSKRQSYLVSKQVNSNVREDSKIQFRPDNAYKLIFVA